MSVVFKSDNNSFNTDFINGFSYYYEKIVLKILVLTVLGSK